MTGQLGLLLELQRQDSEADRVRDHLAHLPEQAEVDRLALEVRRGEGALAHASAGATEARRAQDHLETQLGSLEAKAAAVADRLYGRAGVVSSPKELQALQADLDMVNRQKGELEDRVLEAMEERESAAGLEKRTEEALSQLRDQLREAESRLAAARVEGERELAEAEARSEAVRPDVEAEVLELYDRIRTQMDDGVAAAPLQNGVCGGCQLRLSSAEYEVARHTRGLVRCEACRRILVMV